jgi:uridine kinase
VLEDLVARARTASRPVVLIDGRSGTGKTTLAAALAPRLDAQLVHLDDVYPGWDGLDAASEHVVAEVLAAPDRTGRPRWRRWDWGTDLPAEWHALDATRPLVVEGCGALSRAAAERATLRIWLEGDDEVRKRRAIERDGATFAREWDRWAAEEDAFLAREDPRSLADVVLRLGCNEA